MGILPHGGVDKSFHIWATDGPLNNGRVEISGDLKIGAGAHLAGTGRRAAHLPTAAARQLVGYTHAGQQRRRARRGSQAERWAESVQDILAAPGPQCVTSSPGFHGLRRGACRNTIV